VQHGERLSIVLPHSHLESVRAGDRISDDTTHLETGDFPRDDTVFDHDVGSTVTNGVDEGKVRRDRIGFDDVFRGNGRTHGDAVDLPHPHVGGELGRSPSENTGVRRSEHVDRRHFAPSGPRQRHAETTLGTFLDQHPRSVTMARSRTDAEPGLSIGFHVTEVLAYECVQLEAEQSRANLGVDGSGHPRRIRGGVDQATK
jgi:hypothetical protein